jgi:hypothetical protein
MALNRTEKDSDPPPAPHKTVLAIFLSVRCGTLRNRANRLEN